MILAPLGILVCLAVFLLPDFLSGAWWSKPGAVKSRPEVIVVPPPSPKAAQADKPRTMDKNRLAEIIGPRPFNPNELFTFKIEDPDGHGLFVRTTMNPGLQAWAIQVIPKVQALSAALVAMDPNTGEVLAMASYNSDGNPVNLALNSSFPAASLFKIVTAAAAVENKQMTSNTTLAYDGRKHTLYKSHLNGGIKQGRNQVTLREGFAESINTVFGKLGAFTLGPETLAGFAQRFHFNQSICFEMPVQKSNFDAFEDEDPYHLAELASGFNRPTKGSPLHGAMLASAIINNGELKEPTVVREVFDQD
ncbi:MAG: penicillin-binding transpeptidase domain-containing protein, partial [Pseudomonadota bacterium]